MPTFDDEKQDKQLEAFHAKEAEDLARLTASNAGVEYLNLTGASVSTEALALIPEERARALNVAAYFISGKRISLAALSPTERGVAEVVSELEAQGFIPTVVSVSRASLERVFEHYSDISHTTKTEEGVVALSEKTLETLLEGLTSIDDVKKALSSTFQKKESSHTSHVMEAILASAVFLKASDVHLEPGEESVRLRFRLDGMLTDITTLSHDTYHFILSRVKLLSGLKLNVKNTPQDGRFSVTLSALLLEVRTSLLPDNYGETVVLRILNPETIALSLGDLGIHPRLYKKLLEEIDKPNGMLITTGPTGSGKTTTLYAFIKHIHTPEVKIITIEDPVEYHVDGIVQTQVDHKSYTFSGALRSALRQDPDVIMVGEMRDEEVADTAVQAALTGHFVFSTLHTNNAAGALPRLIDLNVNPKIIGSALSVVMAQRLVRKLCSACKKEVVLAGEVKTTLLKIRDALSHKEDRGNIPTHIYEPQGCAACNETGYRGRIGVYEAIFMNEAIEKLIPHNPSEREIMKTAHNEGWMTMAEDGTLKVLSGITSFDELNRVISLNGGEKQEELDKAQTGVY